MSTINTIPKQRNDICQKIWDLRNKMAEQMKKMEVLHAKQFQTVGDAVDALYAVHGAWDSKEYAELESLIKEIRGEG